MGKALKAAIAYFALVFGAGFTLGMLRVLFVVPLIGDRAAELIELPVMLVVVVLAARWVTRRLAVPVDAPTRLAMGGIALGLMLAFEFTVVLKLRGMTLRSYIEGFDPVAGSVYYAAQLAMGLMPWILARREKSRVPRP
jgi:hypothetical protein